MAAWVYIVSNRKFGALYIGATTNLVQRVWQHKGEFVPAFTKRYHVNRLV